MIEINTKENQELENDFCSIVFSLYFTYLFSIFLKHSFFHLHFTSCLQHKTWTGPNFSIWTFLRMLPSTSFNCLGKNWLQMVPGRHTVIWIWIAYQHQQLHQQERLESTTTHQSTIKYSIWFFWTVFSLSDCKNKQWENFWCPEKVFSIVPYFYMKSERSHDSMRINLITPKSVFLYIHLLIR